jgi:2-dehydro-3-deoxygluconokinase
VVGMAATTTPALVTLGETMALFSSDRVGPLRHAATMRVGIAGAESNVAIGVRRLGHPAAWIGRVGSDELGHLVLGRLRAERVDVDAAVVDQDAPTGLMVKEHRTADLTRVVYYRRDSAGSRLEPGDLDEARIRAARVLHLTGITPALSATARAAVHAAAETARGAGVPVSLDVNYRAALWSPERTGAACGAFAVTVSGDWEGLPSREELDLLRHGDGTVLR